MTNVHIRLLFPNQSKTYLGRGKNYNVSSSVNDVLTVFVSLERLMHVVWLQR